ncbi:MAG: hypothetical protein GY810_11705 [Aureispira sp.]|nr:hypothetical protein [Aureispira sp.]
MKNKILTSTFLVLSIFMISCGGDSTEEATNETTSNTEVTTPEVPETEKTNQSCGFAVETKENFLSYVGSSTFESEEGNYLFFRADGTMAGGGNAGEGSMWEANWDFEAGTPTGKIVFTITMEPGEGSPLSGAHNVEIFPDDGALIFNCVDYIKVQE